MSVAFADSFYFFALLNQQERAHARAMQFAGTFSGTMVTTGWVLTELGDGMAKPAHRSTFIQLVQDLSSRPNVVVVPCSEDLHRRGIELYGQRLDKEWSLTDCLSFVVMQEHNIVEALTGDRHFEQAGFVALLK